MKKKGRVLKSKVLTYPYFQYKQYQKYLLSYINNFISLINQNLISNLQKLDTSNEIRKDDYNDDIDRIIQELKSIIENDIWVLNSVIKYAKVILNFTKKQLTSSLSVKYNPDLIVNIFEKDQNQLLKSWATTNSRLIKSIPLNLLDDVATIIESGFRSGLALVEIKNQIKVRFNVSEAKAKLLARDQTAKLHSNYIRNEHLKLGIKNYIWLTAGDERVRHSHRVLNNKVCSWDDATIYKNDINGKWLSKSSIGGVLKQVGEDYQCRCSIYAILE